MLELYTGELPPAKAAVLIAQLPMHSRTVRAAGGKEAVWSTHEHLLAHILDATRAGNWQRAGKGPKPKPIKRPGEAEQGVRHYGKDKPKAKKPDQARLKAYLDHLHGRT